MKEKPVAVKETAAAVEVPPPEELKIVESLREEWKAYQKLMEDRPRILRISDRADALCVQHFPFGSGRPLNGIVHYLTRVCGGASKMQEQKVLVVTASSVLNDQDTHAPIRAVDQQPDTFFHSKNEPNQWLCLNFNEMQVIPTVYTLQTRHDADSGCGHPKSWIVECSETGSEDSSQLSWIPLDVQEDVAMNRKSARKTFNISNAPKCRSIRIQMIGLNHDNDNRFVVGQFELFGTLLSTDRFPASPSI
jgi:hypothetical protein